MFSNTFLFNNVFAITATSLRSSLHSFTGSLFSYTVENEFKDLKTLVSRKHLDPSTLELIQDSGDGLTRLCFEYFMEVNLTLEGWLSEHHLDASALEASATLREATKEFIDTFSIGELKSENLRDSLINLQEGAWDLLQTTYALCFLFLLQEPIVLLRTEENAEEQFQQLIQHQNSYNRPLIILGMGLAEMFADIEEIIQHRLLSS